jgi:hypothetical protein
MVRKELRAHLDNLPDLSLLPDVTGGLAPLPSAGDLFARWPEGIRAQDSKIALIHILYVYNFDTTSLDTILKIT